MLGLRACKAKVVISYKMIGYVKYFTTLANGIKKFLTLIIGLVRNVKFTCDVSNVYTNDSLQGVCFHTVNKAPSVL